MIVFSIFPKTILVDRARPSQILRKFWLSGKRDCWNKVTCSFETKLRNIKRNIEKNTEPSNEKCQSLPKSIFLRTIGNQKFGLSPNDFH